MKSLVNINPSVLQEYDDWKNANTNWNISDYIHLKCKMNDAIAISKMLFPDFLEKEGCVILKFLYDEETFLEWFRFYKGDVKKVEYKCNLYEVMDYFNNNREEYESDTANNSAIDEFSKILKKSWEINLSILFPERKMNVDVFDEYNTTRITIFTS
jgi:hypothetical protein